MAAKAPSPALDPQSVPARRGSSYPEPFKAAVEERESGRSATRPDDAVRGQPGHDAARLLVRAAPLAHP